MATGERSATGRRTILATAVLAVALLWGCSTPPGSTPPVGGEDWSTLSPGGEVEGPEGTRLIAPREVLSEPVDVDLGTANLPSLALDEGLEPVGGPVLVLARTRAATASGEPLVLELPLPPGVDPSTGGIAVYMAGGEASWHEDHGDEGDPALDDPFWDVVELQTDESGTKARLELAMLTEAGMTVQVVAGADFVEGIGLATQAHGSGFAVICKRKDQDVCNQHEADALTAFNDAHARFSGMGFDEPFLRTNSDGEYKVNLRPYKLASGSGTCKVDTDLRGRTGRYNFPLRKLTVCVGGGPFPGVTNDTGWTAGRTRVAAHELFHAVQYSYGPIRLTPMQMWSMEGTANLSEASTATDLVRDNSDPRPVDVPLDLNFIINPGAADSNQYRTQDFFAFLGEMLAPGQGLSYLIEVFEEGPQPPDVSRAIENFNHISLHDLSDAYWAWARNQTFEKTVKTNTRGTNDDHPDLPACELLPEVATPHRIFMLDGSTPSQHGSTLPPLTSEVVQIVVEAPGSLDIEVLYNTTRDAGIRAALYDPNDCLDPDIGAVGLFTVPAGTTVTRWLLVSNTEFRQGRTRDFDLQLSYGQIDTGVEIVQPQDGVTIGEDETFTLQAEGVGGVLPGDAELFWTYSRDGGVPVTLAMERADTPVTMPTVCDGSYVISVQVFDGPDAYQGATDDVTVTVEDVVPRPTDCAWSVDITQPTGSAVVPVGEAVTFRALIDDDHPETDAPLDTIVWSRREVFGGITFAQFGTGLETTGSFSEGFWDVRVTYGDATDTIRIQADAGSPPSVNITSPIPGTVYDWEDHLPGPQVEIPLEANVNDPEDGPLTGASVTWQIRQENITDWSDYATGTSSTHTSFFNSAWVEFRVVAVDSDGFETISDPVRVEFIQPES